jgi:hypothetical protein
LSLTSHLLYSFDIKPENENPVCQLSVPEQLGHRFEQLHDLAVGTCASGRAEQPVPCDGPGNQSSALNYLKDSMLRMDIFVQQNLTDCFTVYDSNFRGLLLKFCPAGKPNKLNKRFSDNALIEKPWSDNLTNLRVKTSRTTGLKVLTFKSFFSFSFNKMSVQFNHDLSVCGLSEDKIKQCWFYSKLYFTWFHCETLAKQ